MGQALCHTLVGRGRELHLLEDALASARSGHGRTVVVSGEAGMGKSRLVRELADYARRAGSVVMVGRAVAASAPVAYRPIAEALQSALRRVPLPDSAELVPYQPALGRLIPQWRQSAASAWPDDASWLLAEGVLRLVRALAGQDGALVVLEDLHWGDPDSLALVEYLADNLDDEGVLLLITRRSGEPGPGTDVLGNLVERRTAAEVVLRPLDDAAVAEMVAECVGPMVAEPAVVQLAALAEGIPLLVEELLATAKLAEPAEGPALATPYTAVPHSFADTIRRRLSDLGESAQAVLQAAAVLGRSFDWHLLAPITALAPEAVLDVLGRAERAQLLRSTGHGGDAAFAFRHALTGEAVLGELLPHERARLATGALAAMEAADPSLEGPRCNQAAELARMAGDTELACALLVRAGRSAATAGAFRSAEQLFRRAGELDADVGHVDAMEGLTEVLAMAGQPGEALDVGRQLVIALSSIGAPPERQTEASLLLARAAAVATRWDEAGEHLEAAAEAGATGMKLQSRIDALRAHIAMGRGSGGEAVAHASQVIAASEAGAAPEAICEAFEVLGREARLRDLAEAVRHFERAEGVARNAGLPLWRLRALHELGTVDMLERLSVTRLEEARPLADQLGAVVVGSVIDLQLAGTFTLRFEPEPALAASARCTEVARRGGIDVVVAMGWAHAAAAHAVAGRAVEMELAITEAMSSGEHPDVVATTWGHARAMRALLEEDRSAAREALDAAVHWAGQPECTIVPLSWGLRAVVRTLEDRGGDLARSEARTARFLSTGFNRALLGYADAISAGRTGDHAKASTAVAGSDRILARYESADGYRHLCRRLVAEAAIADGWGNPAGWLRETLGFCEVRGFTSMATACRRLLGRAGSPVPRRRGGAEVPARLRALGITSREVDVLSLLGARLANQEIADQLFLSVRTVEKHVERIMDKTGVRSRSALAAFAREGA